MKDNSILWNETLQVYVQHRVSPDGRDTFESTPQLTEALQVFATHKTGDCLLDLGCGWGASLQPFVGHFKELIGVDVSTENLQKAQALYAAQPQVHFLQGELQDLPITPYSVDLLISSLVLHQVPEEKQVALFCKIAETLKPEGEMVFADELLFFDPEADPMRFNGVYRYLLANTLPATIYEQHIKPYLVEGYTYTWQDMKENTPPQFWFHSLNDLQAKLSAAGLVLKEVKELTPFFGMLRVVHSV